MDVPHALTRPLLVRSTFLLRAPSAFPLLFDLDSFPQQRTRHTTPLPHPGFRGRGTSAPPLLSSTRVFSCISPAVLRPSRSSLQTRRHEDRSPVSSFTRHGLCIPPFPLAPHESSYPKQKMPSGSAFPRRLVFPSLPCVCVPRLPSPAPHLLCIPGEAPATPACPRPAASPYHTQKARLHEADGPLHCKKAPIRNQACIPG